MEPPPFAKRSLRPTASLPPTTAEFYGQKHGIDPATQLALQNVGRRSRQIVSQPSFQRTSTAPVSFNAPSSGSSFAGGSGSGFQTSHEIMAQAKGIVNKEAWRRSTRELQPYGSGSDLGQDSEIGDMDSAAGIGGIEAGSTSRVNWERGMKRTYLDQDEGEGEDDEEGTEVDEDEHPPQFDHNLDQGQHQSDQRTDEFPPVFQSPNLTQPELFHRPRQHPQFPLQDQGQGQVQTGRLTRGLPARSAAGGRTLGKTVSAPVGSLWGGAADVEMDQSGQGEDGFDISEWAKEEF